MKIYRWLGIVMIAVCAGAQAQAIHKCVGKDGKTAYSSDPCPGSTISKPIENRIPPPAAKGPAAAAGATGIPDMQAGKWKLRLTRNGRTNDNEMCGDPIEGFRGEVQTYTANSKQSWGCTMTTSPSGRNVTVVYDCPSDKSPDGRPVQKGRWELSLVSASPQAFRIEMKTTTKDSAYVMEGTRIGECTK